VVLGATGQVGRGLLAALGPRGLGLSRAEADLTDVGRVITTLDRIGPGAVINAAAYTEVDRAEREEGLASQINGVAPGVVARFCAERAIPMVHFSTDYVFPGTGHEPWREDDPTAPLGAYGRGKLIGEQSIAAVGGQWLIFRTSWVYDANGSNFVTTMLGLGRDRAAIDVVSDQWGAPTYAPSLAGAVVRALDQARGARAFPSGIYHLCGAGACSWHEFAEEIFAQARRRGVDLRVNELVPVAAGAFGALAPRPHNSRLSTTRAAAVFGLTLPAWTDGLAECLDVMFGSPEHESFSS
jgi:dTDP-4-dehydrorhamnose reductase